MLTAENYKTGLLIDEECMGGITEDRSRPGRYIAYVLMIEYGKYLVEKSCATLQEALDEMNQIKRDWRFEVNTCGTCKDDKDLCPGH